MNFPSFDDALAQNKLYYNIPRKDGKDDLLRTVQRTRKSASIIMLWVLHVY